MKKLIVDLGARTVTVETEAGEERHGFATPTAFAALSHAWLQCGWDTKHVYTFTWLGRPIIQLPEDLVRLQEVIYSLKPDLLIETGIAHGGSLVFYAGLFKAIGKGRVVGIDVALRPHNREAIQNHELASFITLVDGSSIDPSVVTKVHALRRPGETTMVVLDSNHSRGHVRSELEAYAGLVSPGSYLVATDGIMKDLTGAPRSAADWSTDNPFTAVQEFLAVHPEFALETPTWRFNESERLNAAVTYWPGAWLRRQ